MWNDSILEVSAEAERIAVERGRTLLVLDTAEEGGAAGLYARLGYQRVASSLATP